MKRKLYGISSVVIGLIVCVIVLVVWLSIDFFSNYGMISTLGVFVYFLTLFVSGIFLLAKSKLAIIFYWTFILGLLIERIVSLLRFNLSWAEIVIPIIISLPFIGVLMTKRKYSIKKELYIAFIIIGLLNICLIFVYIRYPNLIL